MKHFATNYAPLLLLAAALPVAGQQTNPPPIKGMAYTVGLYVYPQKQQSATQQLTDEQQCYNDAKTQTGFNPDAATPGTATTAQNTTKDHGAAKGAAKGAARGAAISGATGGDPAAGAERGSMIGGMRSKHKEKQQEQQTEKQADAAKTQEQQNMDNFKRSMSACLDARGYSVR
jgi:hypothetical protein